MESKRASNPDPEITAIGIVFEAMKDLEPPAQARVLEYVSGKLGIKHSLVPNKDQGREDSGNRETSERSPPITAESQDSDAELDGVSPVAQKWMTRNAISPASLQKVFSIGGDDIDLIAQGVPGKSMRAKAHSVLLLKGIAAYLATGAARITHQQLKETCLHYHAYDGPNFARYLKEFAPEVSGSKESGYTLTARGLAAAAELVKGLVGPKTHTDK